MPEPLDLNDVSAVEAFVRKEMKAKGFIWDGHQPHMAPVPSSGAPFGSVKAIGGRILDTNFGRMEFVGPVTSELEFWLQARLLDIDDDCQ